MILVFLGLAMSKSIKEVVDCTGTSSVVDKKAACKAKDDYEVIDAAVDACILALPAADRDVTTPTSEYPPKVTNCLLTEGGKSTFTECKAYLAALKVCHSSKF